MKEIINFFGKIKSFLDKIKSFLDKIDSKQTNKKTYSKGTVASVEKIVDYLNIDGKNAMSFLLCYFADMRSFNEDSGAYLKLIAKEEDVDIDFSHYKNISSKVKSIFVYDDEDDEIDIYDYSDIDDYFYEAIVESVKKAEWEMKKRTYGYCHHIATLSPTLNTTGIDEIEGNYLSSLAEELEISGITNSISSVIKPEQQYSVSFEMVAKGAVSFFKEEKYQQVIGICEDTPDTLNSTDALEAYLKSLFFEGHYTKCVDKIDKLKVQGSMGQLREDCQRRLGIGQPVSETVNNKSEKFRKEAVKLFNELKQHSWGSFNNVAYCRKCGVEKSEGAKDLCWGEHQIKKIGNSISCKNCSFTPIKGDNQYVRKSDNGDSYNMVRCGNNLSKMYNASEGDSYINETKFIDAYIHYKGDLS
jgi:hypothetical protein